MAGVMDSDGGGALGADGDDDGDVIAAVNIIPFVDIVLVLLVIFMLTSTALVKASLMVELPQAASAGDEVETTLNVVLTADNGIMLNGERTTEPALIAYVKSRIAENPKLQAVIAADKNLDYGKVVHMLDVIKRQGVRAFALNIQRVPEMLLDAR